MVTRLTREPEYSIRGVVVDRKTQRGVAGVRVDAWDRDTRYHDLLGQVTTASDGSFTIGYDSVYFGDFAPDRSPDVYFKVYLDGHEVLDTFQQTAMNVQRGTQAVRLQIDLPAVQTTRADLIGVETTLKAVTWWRTSDFAGVAREGRSKLGTVASLLGTSAGRMLADWDFEPVRPTPGVNENQVVGQNVQQASASLAQSQVQVTEVKTFSGSGSELKSLADYPLALKAGDRVTLYQRDGVVRYYTRTPALDKASVDAQAVARIDGEVQTLKAALTQVDGLRTEVQGLKATDAGVDERLGNEAAAARAQAEELARVKAELTHLRQAQADKDAQMAELRSELRAVRTDTDNLARRIPLERLLALEERLGRFDAPVVPARAPAATPDPADDAMRGEGGSPRREGD